MKNPIFAVIIPVYNGEQYISDCLNSLLQQSYKNWVAIVIDDGSKDNSLQLLQQYAHKDSRINVFTKKNEGVSKARNYALSKLENYEYDWICFLDIDDWFDPERFQNIAEKLLKYNNDQIDFIRAFSLKVKDRDMKLSLSEKLDADILSPYDYYANENVGGYMHTCLLSKELFEKYNIKFPEDMNFLEDQVFVQKYAMRATLIMCYKTKDYFYYVPNIHKKYRNFYPDILKCINYIFDDVITLETPSPFPRSSFSFAKTGPVVLMRFPFSSYSNHRSLPFECLM